MFKRGQVSIYVVIGGIVIILIGMFIVLYQQGYFFQTLESVELKGEAEQVRFHFKDCFEKSFLNVLYVVGLQGGRVVFPVDGMDTESGLRVSYGYFEGKNLLVPKNRIEVEINDYLNFVIPNCVDETTFVGLDIMNTSKASARVEIFNDYVEGRMYYPVEVRKDDKITRIEEIYEVSYPIRLGRVLDFVNGIILFEIDNPGFVPLTYLDESGMEVIHYNIDIDKGIHFYLISDPGSRYNDQPFVFQILSKVKT